MEKQELTPKERKLLNYIREYKQNHYDAPTLVTMAEFLDNTPTSSSRIVKSMQAKGWIKRTGVQQIEIL